MAATEIADITAILSSWRRGDHRALKRLVPLVYDELHALAHCQLRRVAPGNTLDATALVNEAYLKLVDHGRIEWQDRQHFLAVSALAMRHILVNAARASGARKRGGDLRRVTYDEARLTNARRAETVLALDEALKRLADEQPRMAAVVELRFFGGLTEGEIAETLAINERTVRRDWAGAKALLSQALSASPPGTSALVSASGGS